MVKELNLTPLNQESQKDSQLKDGIINSYLGKKHANEAVQILLNRPFSNAEEFIDVAEHLAPTAISLGADLLIK